MRLFFSRCLFASLGVGFWLSCLATPISAQQNTGSLTVVWEPNQETDLAGYRIYYGNQSRLYRYFVDVGNVTRFQLTNLDPSKRYFIALTAYDLTGNESSFSEEVSAVPGTDGDPQNPVVIVLYQNYPNPFNPATYIPFYLSEPGTVALKILNLQGQLIRELIYEEKQAGYHKVLWDGLDQNGRQVASGIYHAVLETRYYRLSRPMVILR